MRILIKKRLSYVVIGLFFLLGGVEYAIILPTAWFYLQKRFDAPSYMLGILISSFCLSSLFSGPIMGRWSDKLGRTKAIFLFANLFEIIGNVMYMLGLDPWFLVAGRFVAGIGAGVGAPIIADLTRITTTKERTGVLSMFMAIRQIGLVIGPGCNLFLNKINTRFGDILIDKYSSPGLFMAVLWTVLELLVLFIYWDLPTLQGSLLRQTMDYSYRQDSESQLLPPTPSPSIIPPPAELIPGQSNTTNDIVSDNSDTEEVPPEELNATKKAPRRYPNLEVAITSSNEMIESAERFMVAGSADSGPIMFTAPPQEDESLIETQDGVGDIVVADGGAGGYGAINVDVSSATSRSQDEASMQQHLHPTSTAAIQNPQKLAVAEKLSWTYYYHEFIREEVIAILCVVFIAFFNQTALEAMLTPLAEDLLDWGAFEVSLLYCMAGVECILVFILITFMSRHFQDRTMMLCGFVVILFTIAIALAYLPTAPHHNQGYNLPFFVTGVILDVFGLPFLFVISTSLYSKVTRKETQGFAQGLRRSCGGIGMLLGPLWADSLLTRLNLLLGVMFGLMGVALVMLIMSFKHLKERSPANLTNSTSSHAVNNASTIRHMNPERQPLLGNRH